VVSNAVKNSELYKGIKRKLSELGVDDTSTIFSCAYIRYYEQNFIKKKFSRIKFNCDIQISRFEIYICGDQVCIYDTYSLLERETKYYQKLKSKVEELTNYILANKNISKVALIVTNTKSFIIDKSFLSLPGEEYYVY
jgi:hypothetical protein